MSPILNLQGGRLTSIESYLVDLPWLKELYLWNCELKSLDFLSSLPEIEKIDIGFNDLREIDALSQCIKLKHICVAKNYKIESIEPLKYLPSIEYLDVRANKITKIPNFANLSKVKYLDLSENQIEDITPILGLIRIGIPVKWKNNFSQDEDSVIFCGDNNWKIPTSQTVKQGNAAILKYFDELEKKTQFQNTEIKLILIGNSTAGKTSLSRYLRERVYTQGQPSTHGIQNYRWTPEGRKLEVNIWDFGGQEYYHATHRLFLSRNSVYALVWDAQTDAGGYCDTDIHYEHDPVPHQVRLEHFPHTWWLQNIRHYTQGSNPPAPVLLVQNKCARDGVRRVSSGLEQPPYALLPEWLDNPIDLAAFDEEAPEAERRTWTRRFEEFEERLLDKLTTQLTHYTFATYHRDIRDEVRRLAAAGVNDMSYADFEAMCRSFDEEAKMDLVRIYLHDITGDILYYPEHPRLRERVFLRPDWVCNRIYAILSREVLTRQGLFGLDWVQQALQCDAEEALDFIELMREFELIFDDSDEQGLPTGQYVAPQYLLDACPKPDKLEAAKDYAHLTHAFTLWFPDFLPKSHIARFVAHWGSQAQQRLFWKNGLLFITAGCTALVERVEGNRIRVDIQAGQAKREEAMRQIFQSFLKLEEGEAGFAVSMNGEDFVDWSAVLEAERTRAREIACRPATQDSKKYVPLSPFQVLLQPAKMTAKKIFISYAHADEAAMKELDRFLGPLERNGEIEIWTDRKILPGQKWKETILQNIETADVVLLLVSAHFLDSDFIHQEEIPRALRRMEEHGKVVIPIILNYCLWDMSPLAGIQALPKDAQPIAGFSNPAQAWNEVARGVMGRLRGQEPTAPTADTARPAAGTSITNSKNVISGSTISAGGNIHIGDVYHPGAEAPKTGKTTDIRMTPTERQGIERAIEFKIKVINKLRETLALEDDPTRSIRYEEQLRAAEGELAELKAKLS